MGHQGRWVREVPLSPALQGGCHQPRNSPGPSFAPCLQMNPPGTRDEGHGRAQVGASRAGHGAARLPLSQAQHAWGWSKAFGHPGCQQQGQAHAAAAGSVSPGLAELPPAAPPSRHHQRDPGCCPDRQCNCRTPLQNRNQDAPGTVTPLRFYRHLKPFV